MKRLLKAACAVAALAVAQPASADTVCEWIDFAQRLAAAGSGAADSALTPPPRNPEL